MNDKEWLNSLKPGEDVYVSRSYGQTPEPSKVLRRTATMIVVGRGNEAGKVYERRFRATNGWSVGSEPWNHQHLIQPTAEVKEKYEIAILKARVTDLRNRISTPNDKKTLLKMVEALTPFVKEEKR